MKKFEEPILETTTFTVGDVVTASGEHGLSENCLEIENPWG